MFDKLKTKRERGVTIDIASFLASSCLMKVSLCVSLSNSYSYVMSVFELEWLHLFPCVWGLDHREF